MNLENLQKLISLNLTTEQMAGVLRVLAVEFAYRERRKTSDEASFRKKVRERRMGVSWSKWRKIRRQVIARDGNKCSYCGCETDKIAIDHIVPLYQGGTSDLSNLTVACTPCNSSKGGLTLEEWRAKCQ